MIVEAQKLSEIRKRYHNQTIVLGSGVFDLIHPGHLQYLKSLKQYGDIVVVLVKPDVRVHQGKGPTRPILPETDRAAMVDAIKGVNVAFIGPNTPFIKNQPDPMYEQVLAALEPDVFYSTNPVWKQLEGMSKTRVVISDERTKDEVNLRSTTDIIARVQALAQNKAKE